MNKFPSKVVFSMQRWALRKSSVSRNLLEVVFGEQKFASEVVVCEWKLPLR